MVTERLFGSMTALVTPFKNGKVDEKAYQDFVNWQIEQGTQGLIPVGTTGETPTLSHEEHRRVVALCVEVAAGKVPVIAGAGSNSTEEACGLVKYAKEVGADAALVVVPYYNKPTQEGLYQHFKAVHDSADIPIILYNVPGRTIVEIDTKTVVELAKLDNIVGIKDATSDITRACHMAMDIDKDFALLSGEDATTVGYLTMGGHGCISVTANVAPRLCADLHVAWRAGDVKTVQTLNAKLMPLHKAMFCESSPAPAKWALSQMGKIENVLRQPLLTLSENGQDKVATAMAHAGL